MQVEGVLGRRRDSEVGGVVVVVMRKDSLPGSSEAQGLAPTTRRGQPHLTRPRNITTSEEVSFPQASDRNAMS